MINSGLSKLLTLCLLCSCNLGQYSKYKPALTVPSNEEITKVFSSDFNKALYKVHLSAFSKNFGGLLLVKKTSNEVYRIVFTSELGMTYVDMELNDTGFIMHKTLPELNKYGILNLIKKDIGILLQHKISGEYRKTLYHKKSELAVLNYTANENRNNYYFINSTSEQIDKIEHADNGRIKIEFVVAGKEAGAPQFISVKHIGKRVKMGLTRLEQ